MTMSHVPAGRAKGRSSCGSFQEEEEEATLGVGFFDCCSSTLLSGQRSSKIV